MNKGNEFRASYPSVQASPLKLPGNNSKAEPPTGHLYDVGVIDPGSCEQRRREKVQNTANDIQA